MNLDTLKTAIGVYVAARRGILHDDAQVFIDAVRLHIAELEARILEPEVLVVPEVKPKA